MFLENGLAKNARILKMLVLNISSDMSPAVWISAKLQEIQVQWIDKIYRKKCYSGYYQTGTPLNFCKSLENLRSQIINTNRLIKKASQFGGIHCSIISRNFIKKISEGCWEESESECEVEKDPTFKNYNYEGKVLEKYGKLDIYKILPQTYAKVNLLS